MDSHRSNNFDALRDFVAKRIRRIYPAYACAVLLCLAIGAGMTDLSPAEFWRSPATWHYLSATFHALPSALVLTAASITWVYVFLNQVGSPVIARQFPGQLSFFVPGSLYASDPRILRRSGSLAPVSAITFWYAWHRMGRARTTGFLWEPDDIPGNQRPRPPARRPVRRPVVRDPSLPLPHHPGAVGARLVRSSMVGAGGGRRPDGIRRIPVLAPAGTSSTGSPGALPHEFIA